MATGKFRTKTDNDWNTIYFRFKQGKKFDLESSIGIQVPKGRWSVTKQEILATNQINFKATNGSNLSRITIFFTFFLHERSEF